MIDHLVYAVPDLAAAIDAIEQDWGVRPAMGGKHTGRGSHNALLSLGDGPYLELIAVDPEQANVDPAAHPFRIANLERAVLRTFAVTAPDIDARIARARSAGFDPGEAAAMSRATPSGEVLRWRLTRNPSGDDVVPFLIDWGETPHPSRTSPQGCRLLEFRIEHPEPARIRQILAALEVEVPVDECPEPMLIAQIATPKGERTIR